MEAPSASTRPHRLSTRYGICVSYSPPIVHRDIKPDNILRFVSPDGSIRVKFADFGLSKNTDQLKTYCGTLWYAAPEIYAKVVTKDAERYTAGVDIWSLAVVFAQRTG